MAGWSSSFLLHHHHFTKKGYKLSKALNILKYMVNDGEIDSDLFHLYPTDGYVNSHRGNYPYGDVGSPAWIYTP